MVIYAIDDSKKDDDPGKDDEITHIDINEQNIDQTLDLTSWLEKWLQKALLSKKHNKIFKYKKKA